VRTIYFCQYLPLPDLSSRPLLLVCFPSSLFFLTSKLFGFRALLSQSITFQFFLLLSRIVICCGKHFAMGGFRYVLFTSESSRSLHSFRFVCLFALFLLPFGFYNLAKAYYLAQWRRCMLLQALETFEALAGSFKMVSIGGDCLTCKARLPWICSGRPRFWCQQNDKPYVNTHSRALYLHLRLPCMSAVLHRVFQLTLHILDFYGRRLRSHHSNAFLST
jgi:hypothetical protein